MVCLQVFCIGIKAKRLCRVRGVATAATLRSRSGGSALLLLVGALAPKWPVQSTHKSRVELRPAPMSPVVEAAWLGGARACSDVRACRRGMSLSRDCLRLRSFWFITVAGAGNCATRISAHTHIRLAEAATNCRWPSEELSAHPMRSVDT